MKPEKIGELARRWGGGYVSALARILGLRLRTVQRWHTGEIEVHPTIDLLEAYYSAVAERIGEDEARALLHKAAKNLGRKVFSSNKPAIRRPRSEVTE